MKYTKKHINAVFERLLQYEFTIVSGINCLGGCDICDSVRHDCDYCLLDRCTLETLTRTGIRLSWQSWFEDYEYNKHVDELAQRYPEICDLIEKHGFPVEMLK